MVVVFHCGQNALEGTPASVRGFFQNGYQAVSFFFVLSGFVLAYNYLDLTRQSKIKTSDTKFWIARVARIYPLYLVALVVAIVPFAYSAAVASIISAPILFGGLVFVPLMLQAWLPALALAWNLPAWSLSVEAFFYAVFPWIARRAFSERLKARALPLAFSLVVGFGLLCHAIFPLNETGAKTPHDGGMHHFMAYFPLVHLPTFFFGMTLGHFFLARVAGNSGNRRRHDWLLMFSTLCILVLFALHGRIPPVLLSNVILVPLYGALILSVANSRQALSRFLGHPAMVTLGEASYGIYILHIPLAFWMSRLWNQSAFLPSQPPMVFFVCYALVLFGLCISLHLGFEKPARHWVNEFLNARFRRHIDSSCHFEGTRTRTVD